MFRSFSALFLSSLAGVGNRVVDAGALDILSQQVRDCAASLSRAKGSLAMAVAHGAVEARRLEDVRSRVADLEHRVSSAIVLGREDLARDGASLIAVLETEMDTAARAASVHEREVTSLRMAVSDFERRLVELERGRRVAVVERSLRDARKGVRDGGIVRAGLVEAESTLASIRERQSFDRDVDAAGVEYADPEDVTVRRLAAAGCGRKLAVDADDVLRRIRASLPPPEAVNG